MPRLFHELVGRVHALLVQRSAYALGLAVLPILGELVDHMDDTTGLFGFLPANAELVGDLVDGVAGLDRQLWRIRQSWRLSVPGRIAGHHGLLHPVLGPLALDVEQGLGLAAELLVGLGPLLVRVDQRFKYIEFIGGGKLDCFSAAPRCQPQKRAQTVLLFLAVMVDDPARLMWWR